MTESPRFEQKRLRRLADDLKAGHITRRDFLGRAIALGKYLEPMSGDPAPGHYQLRLQ